MNSDADTGAATSSAADDAIRGAITPEVAHAIVQVACRAPSIHNTQPWLWEAGPHGLDLRADRERQLAVADPDGHSLLISCGAAVTLTGVALRGVGLEFDVRRLPFPDDPDLLARFVPTGRADPTAAEKEQMEAALVRRSDRRPFAANPVADEAVEQLRSAAGGTDVYAHFPVRADEQLNLAVAVSWADRVERDDQAYVEEMTRWLRDDEVHSPDGVPLGVIPKVDPAHPRHVDVPLRDFEVGASGRELIAQDVDEHPLIAVILTDADSAAQQLQAGESMMRLMLEAELLGVACCPLSQAVDLLAFRRRMQALMNWQGYPQMMLRLGYPANAAEPLTATPRRPISSVLRAAPNQHP
jgi:nitroreductase